MAWRPQRAAKSRAEPATIARASRDLRPESGKLVPSWRRPLRGLPQRIDGQAAQHLGIEIRGLLRQNFAGERDVAHLLHADRVHNERDVGAVSYFVNRFVSVAHIFQVLLIANVIL